MPKSLKSLNCETFEFTVRFDDKDFNKEEFKEYTGGEIKEQGTYASHYNSKRKRNPDHAHLLVSLDGEDSYFEATFHQGTIESDLDTSDVTLEDSVKWFSDFLAGKEFLALIKAFFSFDETYRSLLNLDYPLLIDSKLLSGAVISGHEITFAKDFPIKRLFIGKKDEGIAVAVFAINALNLTTFDVYTEVRRISKYVEELVHKRGDENAKDSQKRSR